MELYHEMLKFFNGALTTEEELLDFIKKGNLESVLHMGIEQSENINDEAEIIDLI